MKHLSRRLVAPIHRVLVQLMVQEQELAPELALQALEPVQQALELVQQDQEQVQQVLELTLLELELELELELAQVQVLALILQELVQVPELELEQIH